MRTIPRLMIAVGLLLCSGVQATASIISLTYDDTEAGGAGFGGPGVHQHHYALDGIDHTVTASHAAASATTTTNYGQPNANTVVLGWTGNQTRIGEAWVRSTSFTQLQFIVNQNSLTYSLDGLYEVNSLNPLQPGTAQLIAYLEDVTLGQLLFYRQIDSKAPNAELLIDGPGGIFEGSPTGSLIMGHEYRFKIEMYTEPFFGA